MRLIHKPIINWKLQRKGRGSMTGWCAELFPETVKKHRLSLGALNACGPATAAASLPLFLEMLGFQSSFSWLSKWSL